MPDGSTQLQRIRRESSARIVEPAAGASTPSLTVRRILFAAFLLTASLALWIGAHPPSTGAAGRGRPAAAPARAQILPAPPAVPGWGELRISIDGLKETTGTVLIGLYDSRSSFDRAVRLAGESGFANDPERVAGVALRAGPSLRAAPLIADLPAGYYAAIVFHDVDGDGRLDKNAFGIPIEPYGFSNNAQGILGPPSFEDASFRFDGCGATLSIQLIRHGADAESEADSVAAATSAPRRACAGG